MEGGVKLPPPQRKKLPSKRPVLLGLTFETLYGLPLRNVPAIFTFFFLISANSFSLPDPQFQRSPTFPSIKIVVLKDFLKKLFQRTIDLLSLFYKEQEIRS